LAALTFGPGISVRTLGFLGSLSSNVAHAFWDGSGALGSVNVSVDATARHRRNLWGIATGRALRRGVRRLRSIAIEDVNRPMACSVERTAGHKVLICSTRFGDT